MKILYGVVGEGMGHATRSSVILEHLVERHEVHIVVSGRAHEYVKRRFPRVTEIEGLKMAFDGAALDRSRTIWETIKRLPEIVSNNFDEFVRFSEQSRPQVVISDFESFAYAFGKHHELPVISLDNMQIINRCRLEVEIPPEEQVNFQSAKALVKAKLPGCQHYLITSFFFPPLRKERTSLHPPVLRSEILEAPRSRGDHLLVYRTSGADERLLDILQETGLPCRVYGFHRDERVGQLELRPFSERGFVKDLASCRAVVAPGGDSLMGEAVYLHKPMLAVPLQKQFEQLLNALYLEQLGYGRCCPQLSSAAISDFWSGLQVHEEALAGYQQAGNQQILDKLDGLLDAICAVDAGSE